MITKILDNYYRKQVQKIIYDSIIKFEIDIKFNNGDLGFQLLVKKKKYNDNQYVVIYMFHKELYLYYLANLKDMLNEIDILIRQYFRDLGSDKE